MKTKGLVFEAERSLVEPDELYDMSRYGHTCTTTGATWVKEPSGLWVQSYDGDDDYIDLGTPTEMQGFPITILAWIKRGAVGAGHTIFGAEANGMAFYFRAANNLGFGKVALSEETGLGTITDTTRYYLVVVTYDGTNAIFYINGSLDRSRAYGDPTFVSTQKAWGIRIDTLVDDMNGFMALEKVYNYVLSATQIRKIFDAERDFFGV